MPYFSLEVNASQTHANPSDWFLIKNDGQWEGDFIYKADLPGGYFYLQNQGYILKIFDSKQKHNISDYIHHHKPYIDTSFQLNSHAIKVNWVGANASPSKITTEDYPFYHNYFIGSDHTKWKGKVPVSKSVKIHDLYDGVNWLVYGPSFFPKHELILLPGVNPNMISFTIEGADEINIDKKGNLVIHTTVGEIQELKPVAWQIINGKKKKVSCEFYFIERSQIGYKLKNYNPEFELIIDPLLIFSTYSGSIGDNFGFTAAFDEYGNAYAGGIVDNKSGEYPVTPGAFQTTYGGRGPVSQPVNLPCDISISKYSPEGDVLLWATYLGGSSNEYPHSLTVDRNNNLVLLGTSLSPDFPMDSLGYDTSYNGNHDIILVKLSEDGSELIGATFFGGSQDDGLTFGNLVFSYADDFRGDIAIDDEDKIYIASSTQSPNIPISSGSSQQFFGGSSDALIACFDSNLNNLIWSSVIGGVNEDGAYSVKINDTLVFVAGGTSSSSLSSIATGYQKNYNGGSVDGYLVSLNKKSGKTENFTFYGSSFYDQIFFMDFDSEGMLYFMGQTQGALLRTPGTYGQNNTGQFIGKITPDLNTLLRLTTYGSKTNSSGSNAKPDITPGAFLVDRCDNIYVSGWGRNMNNMPVTANAFKSGTDNYDFHLIVFGRELRRLEYGTYFGGNKSEDHVDGGTSRFDKNGIIYQSVCASCPDPGQSSFSDFPTTSDAVFPTNLSIRCSNAIFKIDFRITYNVEASFIHEPHTGCSPLTVDFTNTSNSGEKFIWDFGDGRIDSVKHPSHIYKEKGVYQVKLIVLDPISCNEIDSAFGTVVVETGPDPSFEVIFNECSFEVEFINTTKNGKDFLWEFGDNTGSTAKSPRHIYPYAANYHVKLYAKHVETDCLDSSNKYIEYPLDPISDPSIPNVFTPNNDGLNDCYTIPGLAEGCETGELVIYNRWGDIVFKGIIPGDCWNGKLHNSGVELPEGVYYYLFTTERKDKEGVQINGVIHLIRGKH
jgi:gliding motility-associated-like protein